jgi:hypothetical protein
MNAKAQRVDVLAPGMYWLSKFSTVSGMRSGALNRIEVRVLGAVHGERGRYYRIVLPHGVVGIAARTDLALAGGRDHG